MPILVVCQKCRTRFQVNEKFAGQTGPCPKCKAPIRIPSPDEEVKVHAPTEFESGGRSVSGKLVTKPVSRKDTKLEPVVAAGIGAAVLTVLAVTWVAGRSELFANQPIAVLIGLLLVSPPLVVAGYSFLRDDELEPYQGTALYLRTAICAAAYVGLWLVFGYVGPRVLTGELWSWLFVAPPFVATGALVALACLDLDFGNGVFHYGFYLLVTIMLRGIGGMGWLWEYGVPIPT